MFSSMWASNLGLFTIFAGKQVGPDGAVLAFEPEANAHERRWLENIRVNRLSNVRPHKTALSQKTGIRHLASGDRGGGQPVRSSLRMTRLVPRL